MIPWKFEESAHGLYPDLCGAHHLVSHLDISLERVFMQDGQIVWQVTCATCGWKDSEFVVDIEAGKARAAEHLEVVHAMMCRPLPYELEGADAPKD